MGLYVDILFNRGLDVELALFNVWNLVLVKKEIIWSRKSGSTYTLS